MPQANSCKICNHARVDDINHVLMTIDATGKSMRGIASEFGVATSTLTRHRATCLPQSLQDPETERAAPPQPRPDETPELRHRIIAANEAIQRSGSTAQTMIALRQWAQAVTDAITDNGAPQP